MRPRLIALALAQTPLFSITLSSFSLFISRNIVINIIIEGQTRHWFLHGLWLCLSHALLKRREAHSVQHQAARKDE